MVTFEVNWRDWGVVLWPLGYALVQLNSFSTSCFLIPIVFSNLNSDCSNLLDMRNLQEQIKKAFCYQKKYWPTVRINRSSDIKFFENSTRPTASNFKSLSRSLEQFFLKVGQNNFGCYQNSQKGTKTSLNFQKTSKNTYLIMPG